jgi:hypothetical protein
MRSAESIATFWTMWSVYHSDVPPHRPHPRGRGGQLLFPGAAKGEERMFGELAFVDEVERGARRTDG